MLHVLNKNCTKLILIQPVISKTPEVIDPNRRFYCNVFQKSQFFQADLVRLSPYQTEEFLFLTQKCQKRPQ